jgi:hypothetical protein
MKLPEQREIPRLAGGGRSPVRTFLRPSSRLTGKFTGNIVSWAEALGDKAL